VPARARYHSAQAVAGSSARYHRLDHAAVLPAAVGGVGSLVERVAAVGDVADEDAADGTDVDIKVRHLRDGRALEGSDEARDAAVVAGPDGIDGSAVIEALDGLDQPDWNVGGLHDVSQALDESHELQRTRGMLARGSALSPKPAPGAAGVATRRLGEMRRAQVTEPRDAHDLVG
jgi:hypothetical protein